MQRFAYPITLTEDETDGGFVVVCRDVPEAVTQGGTLQEAIEEAEGVLEAAIEMRMADGMNTPAPSPRKRGEHLSSRLTWRLTSLHSVAGRCAIIPRSAG
jgi:antitoxin HicB